MKYIRVITAFFVILICIRINGNAEFVFKNDGSIIKGSIVSDEPAAISVKTPSGAVEWINRKDIMRVIYTDLYMGKVYARLTTGEVIEGYQVDEDRDNFFFRKDIAKPEEFTIPRKKIMFIARTNPTDLKGVPSTEIINISWNPPFKPAKSYRVYIRDVKSNEETFRMAGEVSELSYLMKDLNKSWSYEIYATAISEAGEESLPSEKLIVNTLPEAPEKLNIAEKLSDDGMTVTLTLSWKDVKDPLSRVKSYAVYETEGGERKKKGSSAGSEFVIKDFPAEGRHWFSVAAVNDLSTESDEIKAVYDAGYKIYVRGILPYIYPMDSMTVLADYGYGGLIDIGVSGRNLNIGFETGYVVFSCAEEVKRMYMIPALVEMGYRMPLFYTVSLRPVLKSGMSYDVIEYIVHDKADPLIVSIEAKSSFDPMASAGLYVEYGVAETIDLFAGAEYSALFQKSGRMDFACISFGAEINY